MIWIILSLIVCVALTIKLLFFTDVQRRSSRMFYRFTLLLSAVYAFSQVIDLVYGIDRNVGPWSVLFHLALFIGAFFLKPHHLPWNCPHASSHQDHPVPAGLGRRLLCWLRGTRVHGEVRSDKAGPVAK